MVVVISREYVIWLRHYSKNMSKRLSDRHTLVLRGASPEGPKDLFQFQKTFLVNNKRFIWDSILQSRKLIAVNRNKCKSITTPFPIIFSEFKERFACQHAIQLIVQNFWTGLVTLDAAPTINYLRSIVEFVVFSCCHFNRGSEND